MSRTVLLRLKVEPDIAEDIRSCIRAWREAEMTPSEGFSWILNGHMFNTARLFYTRQQLLMIRAAATDSGDWSADDEDKWQRMFAEGDRQIEAEIAAYKAKQARGFGYDGDGEKKGGER